MNISHAYTGQCPSCHLTRTELTPNGRTNTIHRTCHTCRANMVLRRDEARDKPLRQVHDLRRGVFGTSIADLIIDKYPIKPEQ